MIFYSDIEDRKLTLRDKDAYQDFIERQKSGVYSVEVKKSKPPKTLPQLGYWFGYVCTKLGDHLGYDDVEEMSNILMYEHAKRIDKNGLVVVARVSKLKVDEMNTLITKVRIWAQETFEVTLKPPNKNWKEADINI